MSKTLRFESIEEALAFKNRELHGVIARQDAKGMFHYYVQRGGDPSEWTEEEIRTSARKYDKAFFYSWPVTSGNKAGLKRNFTFGAKPDRYHVELHVETYAIAHL